jgi:hypothetical protein
MLSGEGFMVIVSARKRLAILIDGDNFPPDLAGKLFAEVEKIGVVAIRRVYGGSTAITGWRAMSAKYGIRLHEVLPGKNATDMRLAIDAMDVLYGDKVDGFCIVSSDNDFAELATRLREDGITVNGFGGSNAAAGFMRACDSFVVLAKPAASGAVPVKQLSGPKALPAGKVLKEPGELAKEDRLKVLLLKAFERLPGTGWQPLNSLLAEVRNLQPDFTARAFGASKPITLVRRTKCFDDELMSGTMMVRRKPGAVKPALVTKAA